eukprot:321186-Pyramimonas_sp.AAC.1
MGPRHPWGAAICETVAAVAACWGAEHNDATRIFKLDLAVPGGLRSVKLSPLSRPACGAQH